MIKIKINGIDRTEFAEDLQDQKITFSLNQRDKTVAYAISGNIRLVGPAYEDVLPILTNVKQDAKITISIPDRLSGGVPPLEMILTRRGIKDCGCAAEIKLESDSSDTAGYEILAGSIITDGNFGEVMAAKGYTARVPYCNEPNFIGYLILVIYLLLKGVIDFIGFVISIFNNDINPDTIGDSVVGCSRYHIAVNLNRTMEYWSGEAGLGWSSSILQGKYKDLHLLEGYGTEGLKRANLKKWDESYIINYTPPQILTLLSEVFNADYRIIAGVLRFERRDWFPDNAVRIPGDVWEDYCVAGETAQMVRLLRFKYESDTLDEASHKVQHLYNGNHSFSLADYRALKGDRNINPGFAMSRFNRDNYGDSLIVEARASNFVGTAIYHDMILSRGSTNTMRLLDLDPGSGWRYAKRRKLETGWAYQESLAFKKDLLEFYSIDDPFKYPRYTTEEILIKPDNMCDALDAIRTNSMNVYFQTPYGRAIPEEVDLLIDEGLLSLKNVTIWP